LGIRNYKLGLLGVCGAQFERSYQAWRVPNAHVSSFENFTVGTWEAPCKTEQPYEGIKRRVLCFDDETMQVHYTVKADAVFPEHEHEETKQTVYVIDGAIELFGDHEQLLESGDSFIIGPDVRHGVRGVAERTELLDTFTPRIESYTK
jgi:quercetin dioxygenase-like cupin family protein